MTKSVYLPVQLRRIQYGKLFQLPNSSRFYVRLEYSRSTKTFFVREFDSVRSIFRLSGDSLVFRASISQVF